MDSNNKKNQSKNTVMIGKIPDEIVKTFATTDIGYTWLIKGKAGVGKTTFALNLLHHFHDFEPVYLSTRVAPASIYNQFPFLESVLKENNILDATRTYIPPINQLQRMKDHLNNTLRFSSVPDFLKIIYGKISEYKNPLIVIDSWEAIGSSNTNQDYTNQKHVETLLTEYIRNTNAKLVFISESDDETLLDFIVDGIITLKDKTVAGRTFRVMEINKIRGIERRQKEYVYTLYNNRFSYVPPFEKDEKKAISSFKPTPETNNYYSTGNIALDKIYQGGLRPGTFNLLEIESRVPVSSISPIFIGLLCQFIQNKRGSIVQLVDGINSDLIDKKRLFLYLKTDLISRYMRIFQSQISDRKEIRPYIRLIDKDSYDEMFFNTYSKLSSISKFQPVFAGISYDSLQFMTDFNKSIKNFEKHLKMIRNLNIIELGIINSSVSDQDSFQRINNLTDNLSYVSSTHLKVIERNGSILLYSIKPRSSCLYSMKINNSLGYPQIDLLPIV